MVRNLLEARQNIKVKRQFLVFADRHNHIWRRYLDLDRVNQGAGPRALVEGGKFHPFYEIPVPEEYLSGQGGR